MERSDPGCRAPKPWPIGEPVARAFFLWPLSALAAASDVAISYLDECTHAFAAAGDDRQNSFEPDWTTRNRVVLELQSMRLRDFSTQGEGVPILVCSPFALHRATIADFAPDHSLVKALLGAGAGKVFVTDWRSATPEMRYLSIDNYLADLNVAIDELGTPVDLVGLCQGGWLALVYAARFPGKVRRLVLAGAPVDVNAAESALSILAKDIPIQAYEETVRMDGGRVLGHHALKNWATAFAADDADRVLQVTSEPAAVEFQTLRQKFHNWYTSTVDLPGTYYLQVVDWLYKENRIVEGRFVALGRAINLGDVRAPVFLLAARDDELVSPDQVLATARFIGTPKGDIETAVEPCGHLSLFLGSKVLGETWPRIVRWLAA